MIHETKNADILPVTVSSTSTSLVFPSIASGSNSTQYLNDLTSNVSLHEVSQLHQYNDFLKPKNSNMKSIKDVNIHRNEAINPVPIYRLASWKSINERSNSFQKDHPVIHTLEHEDITKENAFFNETSFNIQTLESEKQINIDSIPTRLYASKIIDNKTILEVPEKPQNTETRNSKQSERHQRPTLRSKSWWKERLGTQSTRSNSQVSSNGATPGSFKRNKLWNSLSRTFDIPESLRKDERKLKKVPKLQIWLSSDTREEASPVASPVLNNTRDRVPRIQLEHPTIVNQGLTEGGKFRALSEGGTPASSRLVNEHSSGLKSPVEKQPTWPICHLLQPRPKLIHQNRLSGLGDGSFDAPFGNKKLELPRQNAVSDDPDLKENENLKPDENQVEWKHRSVSTESQNSTNLLPTVESKSPFRKRLSTAGRTTLGLNLFFGKREAASSRSYSDERSEIYETDLSPRANPSFNSVFSLTDVPSTPSLSWASSHASLQIEGQPIFQRSTSLCQQDLLSLSQRSHGACSRTSSVTSNSYYNYADRGPLRLTIPGSNGSSRRPSLLSMRSMSRSPVPYLSMEYEYDYEYEMQLYNLHSGLVPEATPKLSFTQKLAFPTLYQNSIDRPKPRDPYTEADNSMNSIAKIITVLILTFVVVFVLGGVYKLLN